MQNRNLTYNANKSIFGTNHMKLTQTFITIILLR